VALPRATICADPLEALAGADAAVLVTEWSQLSSLDWTAAAARMRNPLLIDGRNMLDPVAMRQAGFTYEGIGRAAA
jgi:UDPglucose 6-dehydrogenase